MLASFFKPGRAGVHPFTWRATLMRSRGNLNLGGLPPSQGSKRQNRQPQSAMLGACRCGGPGGRPGMQPVCPTCKAFSRHASGVEFSRLIGLTRVGFAPC